MQIYLVGGAVRDQLLGRPVTERDFVVVGATPEQMVALRYKPVGKEFPVFLHPETHDEYALARTERKIAKGYKGFTFYASPNVTLEQDLIRRDLTINAIAQNITTGEVIDPYHGQQDLKNKLLHHVSPAFAEDPVRILRIARFAARFFDFTIHTDTLRLMKEMVQNGEVDALVPERVWQELNKALTEDHPERFFEVLSQCGALAILFPPFAEKSITTLSKELKDAAEISKDPVVRFAALFHNIAVTATKNLCQSLRAPQEYTDLAILMARYFEGYQNCLKYDAITLLTLLENLDAFRRKERFEKFLQASQALDNSSARINAKLLSQAQVIAAAVSVAPFIEAGLKGEAIANALREERLKRIKALLLSA